MPDEPKIVPFVKPAPIAPTTNSPPIERLHTAFSEWLFEPDFDAIDFCMACYLAVYENDVPLWGMLIAPPSSSKTEIAKSLDKQASIHMLSQLTPQTLASGLKGQGDKVSLLKRLPNPCLIVMKDFTTVLQLRPEARSMVLAQLREVYDGRFNSDYGTGVSIDWSGKIGMLACVTDAIDLYSPFSQMLGERFVSLRVKASDRAGSAERALSNGAHERGKQDALKKATADYLAQVRGARAADIKIGDAHRAKIVALADFVAIARTAPHRDWRTHEIDALCEPEGTPRLAHQFSLLARCLAQARSHAQVEQSDIDMVIRVGFDTLTVVRRRLLDTLTSEYSDVKDIADKIGIVPLSARRRLEDFAAVTYSLVDSDKNSGWRLSNKAMDLLTILVKS